MAKAFNLDLGFIPDQIIVDEFGEYYAFKKNPNRAEWGTLPDWSIVDSYKVGDKIIVNEQLCEIING